MRSISIGFHFTATESMDEVQGRSVGGIVKTRRFEPADTNIPAFHFGLSYAFEIAALTIFKMVTIFLLSTSEIVTWPTF
jgi:hypothetical protein